MDYLLAWSVWGVAMVLLLAGGFWLTRWLKPLWLRDLLRFLVAATLLVPAAAGSSDAAWAPAWIVFIFEAFLQTEGDPVDAVMMLSVAWVSAIVLVVAVTIFRLIRRRRAGN